MEVTDRLCAAMNSRDADAFAACFAHDYRSDQPAHPARAFVGREQVRTNWTAVFAGVPDFSAELMTLAKIGDDVEISEWAWAGTHIDGSPFGMRGAMVLGIRAELVAWGRLYMEPVESAGPDIEGMVQATYRPPS